MHNILDSMKPKTRSFRPERLSEYLALQLANKLGDADLVWKYRFLFDHHGSPLIVEAFSNAQTHGLSGQELIRTFEEKLVALTPKEDDDAL